jgi:hypothetical protein
MRVGGTAFRDVRFLWVACHVGKMHVAVVTGATVYTVYIEL